MRRRENEVLPVVTFESCLAYGLAQEGNQTRRFVTFPTILVAKVRREYVDSKWVPQKHAVKVPMPEILDLECLRAQGRQPGEIEPSVVDIAPAFIPDAEVVETLLGMGASANAAAKACEATANNVNQAVNWFFDHSGDPGINDPVSSSVDSANDEGKMKKRVRLSNLLSEHKDAQAKYNLFAILSHYGKNATSGHYVCHIKKSCGWVLFNDAHVGVTKQDPLLEGYVYLYRRSDATL